MILIEVENMLTHESLEYEISRVPCVGELLNIEDDCLEVIQVFHKLNIDTSEESAALVRCR
ncbi:MAG: hypothetical protein ACTSX6_08135 [Candidatus Heimdallarchaeaceae archaeon]